MTKKFRAPHSHHRRPRKEAAQRTAKLQDAPRVIELRRQGFKLAEIAEAIGKSKTWVCDLLSDAREEWTAARVQQTDLLIQAELTRLDKLEHEITERMDACRGDVGYAALAGRRFDCLERRAKLLGLDRPTRHDVGLPNVEQALAGLTLERRAELARSAVEVLQAEEPARGA